MVDVVRDRLHQPISMHLLVMSLQYHNRGGGNSLARDLSACETLGSDITICTDQTGTLILNEMKVTKFCLLLE